MKIILIIILIILIITIYSNVNYLEYFNDTSISSSQPINVKSDLDKYYIGNVNSINKPSNTPFETIQGVDLLSCANKCNNKSACLAYGSVDNICQLFNNIDLQDKKANNYIAGFKTNTVNQRHILDNNSIQDYYTLSNNGLFNQGVIIPPILLNEPQCATQCLNSDDCIGYSHINNVENPLCYLYNANAVKCKSDKKLPNIKTNCKRNSSFVNDCLKPKQILCDEKKIINIQKDNTGLLKCDVGGVIITHDTSAEKASLLEEVRIKDLCDYNNSCLIKVNVDTDINYECKYDISNHDINRIKTKQNIVAINEFSETETPFLKLKNKIANQNIRKISH